jgi:hypothetical protein
MKTVTVLLLVVGWVTLLPVSAVCLHGVVLT